jgi:exosortase/archaeosortase family protein
MLEKLKKYWCSLSYRIQKFILVAIFLVLSWKIVYYTLLKPQRLLDKPLTSLTANFTISGYNFFTSEGLTNYQNLPSDNFTHYSEIILKNNHRILSIADPCNALELMVLYVGFLFCLYTNYKRVFFFSIIGIIAIFILNIMRCYGMIWIAMHQVGWFHIAHHYVFTLVVYSFIFLLWVLYTKSFNTANNEV